MKLKIFINFFIFVFLIKYFSISCENDENIEIFTLESDSTELLDVTDNHNLNLIVTTSKTIYTGIPPTEKTKTEAEIINATSIITISENYLLAACLENALLAKISLSEGYTESILGYSDVDSELELPIPITSCSLSMIEDSVFIGYSKIIYSESETNKINIIIKVNLLNIEDSDGPLLNESSNILYYTFSDPTIKTNSPRQISCEPLVINNYVSSKHKCNNYRVVCVFEMYESKKYLTYAVPINDNFTGLEIGLTSKRIKQLDTYSGFRLYKYNDNTLRCLIKYSVYDLTLTINDKLVITLSWTDKEYLLNSESDLFDYNNEFFFKSQKVDNIYSLQIYRPNIADYFTLNNNNENNIKKLMGYNDKSNTDKDTIFIYQSQTYIKYFLIDSNQNFSEPITIEKICEENEAKLRDSDDHNCYPITKIIKGYKYIADTNYFEICYSSCSFCSESSIDANNHQCESCAEDYLPSYKFSKNCYSKNGLDDSDDKTVENQNDENFISSTCSLYKIEETGECVDQCPETTDYYLYEYDSNSEEYIKSNLNPPKYLFNKKCIKECPSNSIADDNKECICEFAFYVENGETKCLPDNDCPISFPYQNLDLLECYSSLDDCFNNGNNYFFNKYCYTDNCPSDKYKLSEQVDDIKNYFISKLSITNDDIKNKLCICDIINGVWSNSNSEGNLYYQECQSECENGYEPEDVTKLCVEKSETSVKAEESTAEESTAEASTAEASTAEESTAEASTAEASTAEFKTEETTTEKSVNEKEILIPNEYPDDCFAVYEGKCFINCPEGTCLSQNSIELMNCIPIKENTKVFNDICFDNFDEITKNIKSMSDNGEIITNPSGIIIRGYSTNSDNNEIDQDAAYSIVDLGDCENKLKEHYRLNNETELYILGIDSPNKNKSYTTSVYNYGVYLENGTQLDHLTVCQDSKISISSVITNTELVKLEKANYFSDLGYDIYEENNTFYTDHCAPASIDGNDITLNDRKKDFYPANISLCNESCYYTNVNFTTKRFTCECDLVFNSSQDYNLEEESKEDDSSYIDYFLSLINYKITVCFDLLLDFKSYYYNAGLYISAGTFFFNLFEMFFFFLSGMKSINKIILENIPTRKKLIDAYKEQEEKRKGMIKLDLFHNTNNPLKKGSRKNLNLKNDNNSSEEKGKNHRLGNNRKSRDNYDYHKKKKTLNHHSKKHGFNILNTVEPLMSHKFRNSKRRTEIQRKVTRKKRSNFLINESTEEPKKDIRKEDIKNAASKKKKIQKDKYGLKTFISDENITKKEINNVPYTQALRIDKRNIFEIFLSVLFHEIEIINIFYYRDNYNQLSITLSIYVFELCLDLTLNCLLYTDDVVSEKYNNNGSIEFFTSLSLSFMSNIIASIIAFIISKLAEYSSIMEVMIKDAYKKNRYLLNYARFKKYITLKLCGFFSIQIIVNILMCYYLMIFCTVYHKTQGSIMVNYLVGIGESMIISFGLALITSIIRFLSIKYKWNYVYNTSKYFFENF